MYRYIGNSEGVEGVPARDLTDAEYTAYQAERDRFYPRDPENPDRGSLDSTGCWEYQADQPATVKRGRAADSGGVTDATV